MKCKAKNMLGKGSLQEVSQHWVWGIQRCTRNTGHPREERAEVLIGGKRHEKC